MTYRFVQMISVSPIIIFWQACPYSEAGRIKNSSLPSAKQYAIIFRRWANSG